MCARLYVDRKSFLQSILEHIRSGFNRLVVFRVHGGEFISRTLQPAFAAA